jgi:hypothetical protein
MKKLVVCFCVFVAVSYAFADWNPGQPYKWLQLPDLNPTGIDIDTDGCSIIADDFECRSMDKITDVHIWGSWLNDSKQPITSIQLKIFSDDVSGLWSKPGGLLWTGLIGPEGSTGYAGTFTERLYYTMPQGTHEMFWKPNSNPTPTGQDTGVWQYNMNIDPLQAFLQQGNPNTPVTYWLEVKMNIDESQGSADFGWKTRDPRISPYHYKDDAVYYSNEPGLGWQPLEYKNGEFQGQSIDMAFVITPEPATALLLLGGLIGLLRKRS